MVALPDVASTRKIAAGLLRPIRGSLGFILKSGWLLTPILAALVNAVKDFAPRFS